MGDPKKLRKKYEKPVHPWQRIRIEEERKLMKDYGLKNKKELWKMVSILKNYKQRVKALIPRRDKQAEVERKQLINKVQSLNLIDKGSKIEDVLSIDIKKVLDRRLQTIVHKKLLASTIKQARQFVTHEHILIGENKINSPSYLVSLEEESKVKLSPKINQNFIKNSEPEDNSNA
jgi:small subunit ribosomal protein S4